MTTLDGPQWRQLPLLMTHEEVSNLHSREFGKKVSELPDHFESGHGNRGFDSEDGEQNPDADTEHVDEIAGSIQHEGYDERFPLPVHLSKTGADELVNGNHRAAAVHQLGHPLTPVSFYTKPSTRHREQDRQDAAERDDYTSGRREPLTHGWGNQW